MTETLIFIIKSIIINTSLLISLLIWSALMTSILCDVSNLRTMKFKVYTFILSGLSTSSLCAAIMCAISGTSYIMDMLLYFGVSIEAIATLHIVYMIFIIFYIWYGFSKIILPWVKENN